MSLKGRKASKCLGGGVKNLVRKCVLARCDVWLGEILGGKLLFSRVLCCQGYSEVM